MALVKNFKLIYRLVLGKFGLEKVFGDYLDRKQAVLDYKNTDLKRF